MTDADMAALLERLSQQRAEAGQRISAARAALAHSKRNHAPPAMLADARAGVRNAESDHQRLLNDVEIVERELRARPGGAALQSDATAGDIARAAYYEKLMETGFFFEGQAEDSC
jgi:hypothetical protein